MLQKIETLLVPSSLALSMTGFSSSAVPMAEQEGNPWWIWLAIFAALVAFLAFVVWWWLRTGSAEETEATPSASHRTAELELPVEASPALDDLKRIEGIGPKISSVLQAAGIDTFARLSQTDVERLREVLEAESPNLLRLADPATWPEQASLAAQGSWAALEKLQDELKGGRRA
jgi:predicted flap endonuclease-1-like 5' DNA nuclease